MNLPKKQKVQRKNVEVSEEIMDRLEPELEKRKLKFRQVVEWGLLKYLESIKGEK